MVLGSLVLAWFGLALGSFVNALVWRLHEQSKKVKKSNKNLSITSGRSMCPHCKHTLAWYDLIPVFSWLWLRGACRYCKKPISKQYPLVELATAAVFVFSYLFWPAALDSAGQWILFITWLATSVGLMALLVYDAHWMLLPNKLIYPTAGIAAFGRLVYIVGFEDQKVEAILGWALSLAVASGIFWILFVVSRGKWIGFGDVRLGFITGTVLASPASSFLMIFISSLAGTLFILPAILRGNKTIGAKIPYGPFLIFGCLIALLFGPDIIDWYKDSFLP